MPLLVKSIYGCEIDPKKTPFGLLNQQFRLDGVLNNAGWFNDSGEKLGHGDLNIHDMRRIHKEIPAGERFIVLAEFETTWSIPSHLDSSMPGIDYVMQNCLWFINAHSIYRIKNDHCDEQQITKDSITYVRVSRPEFFKLIGYNKKKITEPISKAKIKSTMYSDDDIAPLLKKVKAVLAAKKAAPSNTKFVGYRPVKILKTKSP